MSISRRMDKKAEMMLFKEKMTNVNPGCCAYFFCTIQFG